MSDAEDIDEVSDGEELDLDEEDQNDNADEIPETNVETVDADADDDVGQRDRDKSAVYGPLQTLKIRDGDHIEIIVVDPEERITSNIITDPEFTEATGIRAAQIEQGTPVFTDVTGLTDPIKMAHKEFYDRKNPLILERVIEQRGYTYYVEHWIVREMTYLSRYAADMK